MVVKNYSTYLHYFVQKIFYIKRYIFKLETLLAKLYLNFFPFYFCVIMLCPYTSGYLQICFLTHLFIFLCKKRKTKATSIFVLFMYFLFVLTKLLKTNFRFQYSILSLFVNTFLCY